MTGQPMLMDLHSRLHVTRFPTTDLRGVGGGTIELDLNVFTEFSDKKLCEYIKKAQTCHPATSCVKDQHATTAPARHM